MLMVAQADIAAYICFERQDQWDLDNRDTTKSVSTAVTCASMRLIARSPSPYSVHSFGILPDVRHIYSSQYGVILETSSIRT